MLTIMIIILVVVLLACVIAFFANKPKPAISQEKLNTLRYNNYGHPLDLKKYMAEQFKTVELPPNTMMMYEIKKLPKRNFKVYTEHGDVKNLNDGVWSLGINVQNIFDEKKTKCYRISLEHTLISNNNGYSYTQQSYSELYAKTDDTIRIKQKILDCMNISISNYVKAYPFDFNEVEDVGVL